MLTVLAEIRPRPGHHHRQSVIASFADVIPAVLQEAGSHGYAPFIDQQTSLTFQSLSPNSVFLTAPRHKRRGSPIQRVQPKL